VPLSGLLGSCLALASASILQAFAIHNAIKVGIQGAALFCVFDRAHDALAAGGSASGGR
jgi:hypothetical protein